VICNKQQLKESNKTMLQSTPSLPASLDIIIAQNSTVEEGELQGGSTLVIISCETFEAVAVHKLEL
jgi:hypothetical protein